jgi:D-beta-D-heptose 7-phosphate kinase / D-beta-D-heptose 1-phosphate adenosyltransferase
VTARGSGPLVVVGDALLDRDLDGVVERLSPDAPVPVVDSPVDVPRPGGAGLAALLAAQDGRDVVLVTALAPDDAGRELAGLLHDAGVGVVDLGLDGTTPEKVRVRSGGRSLLRLDHGGPAGRPGPLTDAGRRALSEAGAVLVADYGRGVAADDAVRGVLAGLRVPVVWDPHPRGPEPVPGVTLATPNGAEARHFAPGHEGAPLTATTGRARELAARWRATAVAATLSGRGALLVSGQAPPLVVPAPAVPCPDPCGAGDRFASAAAGGASSVRVDRPLPAAADVGAGADDVVARVRSAGGTVVATGGCFDLLHAGHVAVLQQARALGDCLVVCLNSDDGVRRLKGPSRPVQPQEDRTAVLLALGCVDAVAVFDDDTPVPLLERLRPDVFAKGGDYAVADLPEVPVLQRWGGQVVVLPYLDGRSTTHLLARAGSRA